MKRLTICIDARYCNGQCGGVEQVVIGMAHGLSQLSRGRERYLFLGDEASAECLQDCMSGPCKMLPTTPRPKPRWRQALENALPAFSRRSHDLDTNQTEQDDEATRCEKLLDQARVDVMHFTVQSGFPTKRPNIYHPHDLQHLHFPQFFKPRDWEYRERLYRQMCNEANMVAATSSWIKNDVVRQYGLPEDKVRVVPWAPILPAYPQPTESDLTRVRKELALPEQFLFYPAQTWPHKNHLRLFEALAILRDRHELTIPLVLSGRRNEFYPTLEVRLGELGLASQTHFVDFVSPLSLQCLYRLCRGVVIPTKFEAASFPLWESFLAGAPSACSNVTSLPAQAGNAALLFDPDRTETLADALGRIWTDDVLRETLVKRGRAEVSRFSWDRTVRSFRAHYRRIAGRALSREDRELIDAPPLL